MAFCRRCGARLIEGANFCTECAALAAEVREEPAVAQPICTQKQAEATQQEETMQQGEAPQQEEVPQQTEAPPQAYSPQQTGSIVYADTMPVTAKKKPSAALWIILGAVLLALAVTVYLVLTRPGKEDTPIQPTEATLEATEAPTAGQPETIVSNMAYAELPGYWVCSGVETSGLEFAAEDIFGGNTVYILLQEDGICELSLGENKEQGTWTYTDGVLSVTDAYEATMSGVAIDGTIIIEEAGMKIRFTKDIAPAEEVVENPSSWYGYLEMTAADGTQVAFLDGWGELQTDENTGFDFFEVYNEDPANMTDDTGTYYSAWVAVKGNTIEPIIGVENAWLLDNYLTVVDTQSCSFILSNGVLKLQTLYTDADGTYTVTIYMREYGELWEETVTPPGYAAYVAAITV